MLLWCDRRTIMTSFIADISKIYSGVWEKNIMFRPAFPYLNFHPVASASDNKDDWLLVFFFFLSVSSCFEGLPLNILLEG